MKNKIMKKLMAFALLLCTAGLFARGGGHGGGHGGHGGGHRGGGHRGGGHGRSGHHASGHHGGHHAGGHHGGHGRGGWGRGGWGRGGWGWNSGWGWGYGGWLWGATAAIIAGSWLYGGWTYDQWEDLAAQDPERREYFETVVQPAYQQYQQDPTSVPVRDSAANQGSTTYRYMAR